MEVVWSDQARDKLLAVVELIAQDRPVTARRLANRLFERAGELAAFPELGRPYDLLPGMGLRLLVEPPYGLIYRVEDTPAQVLVVALRHQRESVPHASELLAAGQGEDEAGPQ